MEGGLEWCSHYPRATTERAGSGPRELTQVELQQGAQVAPGRREAARQLVGTKVQGVQLPAAQRAPLRRQRAGEAVVVEQQRLQRRELHAPCGWQHAAHVVPIKRQHLQLAKGRPLRR